MKAIPNNNVIDNINNILNKINLIKNNKSYRSTNIVDEFEQYVTNLKIEISKGTHIAEYENGYKGVAIESLKPIESYMDAILHAL